MLRSDQYLLIMISIGTGLLSLLGSVGIFISLIIQRKVERLQDILEELIDQAYLEEQNLTGTIYRIVQKYQMHYLIPDKSVKTIMQYVDASISMVVVIWFVLHLFVVTRPFNLDVFPLFIPTIGALIILVLFRKLLKYTVDPLDNPLLNGIIPPPTKLRSISFLSGYVNVSVKALLKQARFNLLINIKEGQDTAAVILKEELSFDDFFYYLSIGPNDAPIFVGFGKVLFSFCPDPITGKPTPLQHNINVPIGYSSWDLFTEKEITAHLLLFPYNEKNPVNCTFKLTRQSQCYISLNRPETTIVDSIVYKFTSNRLVIIENKSSFPHLELSKGHFDNTHSRYFYSDTPECKSLKTCTEEAFVN